MQRVGRIGLRVVLALAGAWIAFTGVNVAFGGITTLGWLGDRSFLQVTNPDDFRVQDSHVRFLGGLWLGIGLLFVLASLDPRQHRGGLSVAFAMVFLGGVTRLLGGDFATLLGPKVFGSLIAELVGMPLLFLWHSKSFPIDPH